jgi:hypothetical protein
MTAAVSADGYGYSPTPQFPQGTEGLRVWALGWNRPDLYI